MLKYYILTIDFLLYTRMIPDIQNIILSYLQKFELATIFNQHSKESYLDAVKNEDINYMHTHITIFKNLSVPFYRAAQYNALWSIKFMMDFGITESYIDAALYCAAGNGHMNIIRYLLLIRSKRQISIFTNHDKAFWVASQAGRVNIMKMFSGISSYDRALNMACQSGHIAAAQYIIDNSNTTLDFDIALWYACESSMNYNRNDVINLLVKHGATKFNSALCAASRHGHVATIILLMDLGANCLNDAFEIAETHNNYSVAAFLKARI